MDHKNNRPRRPIKPRLTPEGQELTDTRIELGQRVSDVAHALNVNQGRISEVEIGYRSVSPTFLVLIRQYYDELKESRN